jgi:hypothetical protein
MVYAFAIEAIRARNKAARQSLLKAMAHLTSEEIRIRTVRGLAGEYTTGGYLCVTECKIVGI